MPKNHMYVYLVIAQLSERSKFRSLNSKNIRSKRPNWAIYVKNGALKSIQLKSTLKIGKNPR